MNALFFDLLPNVFLLLPTIAYEQGAIRAALKCSTATLEAMNFK